MFFCVLLSISDPFGSPWASRMGHPGKLFGLFLKRVMPLLPFWVQSASEVLKRLTFARLLVLYCTILGGCCTLLWLGLRHVRSLVEGGKFLRWFPPYPSRENWDLLQERLGKVSPPLQQPVETRGVAWDRVDFDALPDSPRKRIGESFGSRFGHFSNTFWRLVDHSWDMWKLIPLSRENLLFEVLWTFFFTKLSLFLQALILTCFFVYFYRFLIPLGRHGLPEWATLGSFSESFWKELCHYYHFGFKVRPRSLKDSLLLAFWYYIAPSWEDAAHFCG